MYILVWLYKALQTDAEYNMKNFEEESCVFENFIFKLISCELSS